MNINICFSPSQYSWNGTSLLHAPFHHANFDLTIQTDASGSRGYGAISHPHWLEYSWHPEWFIITIIAKELVPNIICCAVWHRNKYSFNVITRAWLWSLAKVQKKHYWDAPINRCLCFHNWLCHLATFITILVQKRWPSDKTNCENML